MPAEPTAPPKAVRPSRHDADRAQPTDASDPDRAADIPPEAGQRAWIDRATGKVHGSGAGAGGGNPGEDYDPGTPGDASEARASDPDIDGSAEPDASRMANRRPGGD